MADCTHDPPMGNSTGPIETFLSLYDTPTRKIYERILREWCEFLFQVDIALIDATPFVGLRFCAIYRQKPGHRSNTRSEKTVRKAMVTLRHFYNFLQDGDRDAVNPFQKVVKGLPRGTEPCRRENPAIPFDKIRRLIEFPSMDDLTNRGARNTAILAALYGGGLRIREALALRLSDLRESAEGTFFVHLEKTKAGIAANQVIAPDCVGYIQSYLAIRITEGAEPHAILFTGYDDAIPNGKVIDARAFLRRFKRWCRECKIKATLHSMRSSAITKLLSDGLTYREVQEFSRHASIQMVEVYDKRVFEIDNATAKKLKL